MNNIALSIIAILNVLACSVAIINYINDTRDKVSLMVIKSEQEQEFENIYKIVEGILAEKEENKI